ncbi:aspartate carbamoyltransferase [Clostridia bacterium]|nr:aspartate carbamoyltransferase [Clostridia bacterium]
MWKEKDFLGLKDVPFAVIENILDSAAEMKRAFLASERKTSCAGKAVVTLFYENSTRTRASFELAAKALSANAMNLAVATSSVAKGESLIDNGKTLDALQARIVVIRHSVAGAPHLLAKNMAAGVINAGDGMNEHPTQALLDMFTIREKFGGFKGLKVLIAGDIKHSRVARSNIYGLRAAGAEITVCAPATLMPAGIERFGVRVVRTLREGAAGADVLMALRLQLERQKSGMFPSAAEYNRFYNLNGEIAALAKSGAIVMHPGPINRGLEISGALADGNSSVITGQVTNGVAVRMALLEMLLAK